MSDGLEKYSGVQKEVARGALTEFAYPNRGIDSINHLGELKFRVESVRQVEPTEVGCSNSHLGEDGYITVISRRTFFGIQTGVLVVSPCDHKEGGSLEKLYPNLN